MIGNALNYIRKRLDAHLRSSLGLEVDDSTAERVVFAEGDKLDPLIIPQGTIGMLVANVQEDREFRAPDRYQRRLCDGPRISAQRSHPDLHLDVAILFLANFKDYVYAWNQLSHLLIFFQEHPVFDRETDLDLPAEVGRLAIEICSQSFQQQNELWSALKTSLRPSILVRVRLMTLWGAAIEEQPVPIQTVKTRLISQEMPTNLRSPPLP